MRGSALLLALAVVLAGCSDAPDAESTDGPDGGPDGAGQEGAAHAMHNLTWADAPTAVVEELSGEFQPNENAGLDATTGGDGGGSHVHPLDVPPGLPVFVRLTLEPQTTQGTMALTLDGPFEAIFTTACDCPIEGGTQVLEAAVVLPPGEQVQAVVSNLNPEPGPAAYTLTTEVYGGTENVPSGIPVAVQLPADGHVQVVAAGDAHNDVLVFDPDDALVAVLPSAPESIFEANGTAGEYVFVHSGHAVAASYRVGGVEDAPRARLLMQSFASGDAVTIQGSDPVTATVSAPVAPIQVGACVFGTGYKGAFDLSVADPDGTVLASESVPNTLTVLPYTHCLFTVMGDARLFPGDHTATHASQADADATLQAFAVTYAR